MARYTFRWDYRSGLYAATAGETAELADDLAAAIDRDSPGVLEAEASETRAVDAPPKDRMVRKAKTRGGGDA